MAIEVTGWRAWAIIAVISSTFLGTSWEAVPKELVADAIVVVVPAADMALHVPVRMDRIVPGAVIAVEKGYRAAPLTIVHTANTFTTPLRQGVPTRLYLKRYPDRDAYYVIGVLPLQSPRRR